MNPERSRTSAFSLLEVLVALALAAGPLVLTYNLIQSNTRAAQFNHDRATARMILVDLVTLLHGESLDGVRRYLAGDGLSQLLSQSISLMPDAAREPYFEQSRTFIGHIRGKLREEIDPSKPGLASLVLTAEIPGRPIVEFSALIRPKARECVCVDESLSCKAVGVEDPGH